MHLRLLALPPLLASLLCGAPTPAPAQPASEGLVVCGGQKTTPGDKKNGVMVTYDKRTKTIEKELRAAGYGQIFAAMSHWSDVYPSLKVYADKYAAFYDRNIASHGPNLAFGELGQRNKLAEVAKFCTLVKPMKVCEDFTAC
ncbi:MAG: hypothetical protein AB7R90_05070 [Reyranellaceae bacterium]